MDEKTSRLRRTTYLHVPCCGFPRYTEAPRVNLSVEMISLIRNPCARKPFYRFSLVKRLPALTQIDGRSVTQEDRLG